MTADPLALDDWLGGFGVTHLAMESTGVYWRPVYTSLEEEGRTILLVNPQHMQAVPGRKTGGQDTEWIAGYPLGACCAMDSCGAAASRPRRSAHRRVPSGR